MIYRVRRLDIISVASTLGALYAALGLLIGLVLAAIAVFGGLASAGSAQQDVALLAGGGIGMGLLALIGAPLGYGALGFIAGAIVALIYNFVAKLTGGIGFEMEAEQTR